MLLLLVVAIFLVVKISPVFVDRVSFTEDLERIVNRAGSENWKDVSIRQHIQESARALEFELSPKDIQIERIGRFQSASRMKVSVKIRRSVEFPGYVHLFEFQVETTSLIGRL